jgi:antitoxin component YwqK of YwqJK toxin-antitoxin module
MQQQTLKDGKPAGKCSSYFPDSKLQSETDYKIEKEKNGDLRSIPDGTWLFYDKNGNVEKKIEYKDGLAQ